MLRADFPDTAKVFDGMAAEEDTHRHRLIELHQKRFGEVIPLIRREHVAGYYARRPVWLMENLGLERIRAEAENMERDAERFYLTAAKATRDADTRSCASRKIAFTSVISTVRLDSSKKSEVQFERMVCNST